MGSLRNPVGPLPSSIYWRRRVVLLSVVALLALLVAWLVTSGGGGGRDNGAGGPDGKNPASSITPGPSGSGPAITEAPGGRDESGDEESGGTGGGDGSQDGSGDGTGDGSGAGSGGAGGSDASGGAGGGGTDAGASGGGVGTGDTLPAGSPLPNCTANAVTLTLRSARNAYSPDQTPAFRLTAKNTSNSDCKVDLGPKNAVLTVTQAASDDSYWSSADCPKGAGSLLYRVPAGSSITYTVQWDRRPSAPECGTPPAGSAGPGTYLLEGRAAGFATLRTSFVLDAD
ncbi:hypothetical protein [Streptomyces chromofuscus]|uniref:Uncharacterized protein n=1 Tax=Streptomyces chromofuscus TaxID=42881 RepID=A0A7M2T0Z6_STRCW|nr:hypothetical protein [Streptomyces chromofuscus]QOV42222.1 hypothetical protein IPT68_20485 [Streptomyces chromofuscus]